MGNPIPPIFNANEMTTIASYGGYSNLVPMSEITNLILLSAMPFISNRNFWQTKLNPISDALWDEVEQWIDTAMGELMTNIAIGSIFYSVALLSDDNVRIPIGQLLPQVDFQSLTAIVPAGWLVGGDIQLPDMRNMFVVGTPDGSGDGVVVGSNTHTLTESELAVHNHTQNPHTHTYSSMFTVVSPTLGGAPAPAQPILSPAVTGAALATNNPSGGDVPHNNKPLALQAYPYLVVK